MSFQFDLAQLVQSTWVDPAAAAAVVHCQGSGKKGRAQQIYQSRLVSAYTAIEEYAAASQAGFGLGEKEHSIDLLLADSKILSAYMKPELLQG